MNAQRLETLADLEAWAQNVRAKRIGLQRHGRNGVVVTILTEHGVEVRVAGSSIPDALGNLALAIEASRASHPTLS